MTKAELLYELNTQMYVALKPSVVHGIGVFAICDIPKGTRTIFSKDQDSYIKLSFDEVEKLPQHSRDFIETYYLYDDENYFLPSHGCKVMDMANYLNHSPEPNIASIEDGRWFEALRDIREGEELFVNYGEIVDGVDY